MKEKPGLKAGFLYNKPVMNEEIDTVEIDNQIKLKKYYNPTEMRKYTRLMEMAESVCLSKSATNEAKIVARGFANHYRRMMVAIAMKPFDPDSDNELTLNDKIFMMEVSRLHKLVDPNFSVK